MFDNLRRAFKEAVENFHQEVNRDQVPEQVDSIVRGMEREAVEAKAALDKLEKDLQRARRRAEAEAREAETCRRREEMAREIGDEETVRVAARYAAKHEERHKVLAEKAEALGAEIRLGSSEYSEMIAQIKEAKASRSAMAARAGRTQARDSLGDPDDLFGEFDRMADKVGGSAAADPLSDRVRTDAFDDELMASQRKRMVDDRLDELKRRMGRK